MGADANKPRGQTEKEQEEKEQQNIIQQGPHVEVNKEEHTSQAKTKPLMETDVEKQDDP